MTAEDRAQAVIRIGGDLHKRLVLDILATSKDANERNEMLAGSIGLVLRRTLESIAIDANREEWLSAIIKMAVA